MRTETVAAQASTRHLLRPMRVGIVALMGSVVWLVSGVAADTPGPFARIGVVGLGLAFVAAWLVGRTHVGSPRKTAAAIFIGGLILARTLNPAEVTATQAVPRPRYWVTSTGTIEAIAAQDPGIAKGVFGSPTAVALGDGWPGALTGRSWASYARFARDVSSGAIPPSVRVVMYDPEGWDETPLNEQQDPITYIERFAALAHARGYFVIITPHPSLVSVPGAACGQLPEETAEAAYLRCRIAEGAARYADAYETQAQALERDPKAYRAFVSQTAAQARAANPNVIMLSGLSTAPGYPATPEMLFAAWSSVEGVVDGHYLSLARLHYPEVAAAFLKMVEASRG